MINLKKYIKSEPQGEFLKVEKMIYKRVTMPKGGSSSTKLVTLNEVKTKAAVKRLPIVAV